jgi:predicted transcriptional regulator with HTH domain
MSVNELSDVTGLSPESVLGAMIGCDDRFIPEDSLVSMGLASCEEELVHGIPVQTFVATRRGLDMKNKLKDYRYRSTSLKARSGELIRRLKGRFRKKQP